MDSFDGAKVEQPPNLTKSYIPYYLFNTTAPDSCFVELI